MRSVEYQYYSGYSYSQSSPVDFKRIDKAVNYSERLDLMEKGSRYFQQEFKRIKREKNSIKSQKISNIKQLLFWDYEKNTFISPSEINSWLLRINNKYYF